MRYEEEPTDTIMYVHVCMCTIMVYFHTEQLLITGDHVVPAFLDRPSVLALLSGR